MSTGGSREDKVYSSTIDYLLAIDATVLCGCPPSGTDSRFQRCLLPKTGAGRDEVDVTAILSCGTLLLIECKGPLSDALSRRNRSNESDQEKLVRLLSSWGGQTLASTLARIHGTQVAFLRTRGVLAVDEVNCQIPKVDGLDVWLVTNDYVQVVHGHGDTHST